jgi:hypothetical protein
MIKTILSLIPFAIFCILGANLYFSDVIDEIVEPYFEDLKKRRANEIQKSR